MHRGVSSSHEISQKKLKGRLRTVGYTRSHRATEKQLATKGTKPRRIAPSDGRFTPSLPQARLRNCSRISKRPDAELQAERWPFQNQKWFWKVQKPRFHISRISEFGPPQERHFLECQGVLMRPGRNSQRITRSIYASSDPHSLAAELAISSQRVLSSSSACPRTHSHST